MRIIGYTDVTPKIVLDLWFKNFTIQYGKGNNLWELVSESICPEFFMVHELLYSMSKYKLMELYIKLMQLN